MFYAIKKTGDKNKFEDGAEKETKDIIATFCDANGTEFYKYCKDN
jgi:hypothetical protein